MYQRTVRAYSESAPADITVFVQDTSLFVQNVWKVDPEVEEIGAIVAEVSLKTKFIELEVEVIDKSVEGQVIETPEMEVSKLKVAEKLAVAEEATTAALNKLGLTYPGKETTRIKPMLKKGGFHIGTPLPLKYIEETRDHNPLYNIEIFARLGFYKICI